MKLPAEQMEISSHHIGRTFEGPFDLHYHHHCTAYPLLCINNDVNFIFIILCFCRLESSHTYLTQCLSLGPPNAVVNMEIRSEILPGGLTEEGMVPLFLCTWLFGTDWKSGNFCTAPTFASALIHLIQCPCHLNFSNRISCLLTTR